MNKSFKFYYKVYSYEDKFYSKCIIAAKNRKEAFIKFVAESNGTSFEEAKNRIKTKFNSGIWAVNNAIESMNPLGSSDLDLYELQKITKTMKTI